MVSGADVLQFISNDSFRLDVKVQNGAVAITPQLHQHGIFSISAVNSASMLSPALIVLVEHINHPPYLKNGSISPILKNEDDVPFVIALDEIINDVDTINQNDPYSTPDKLIWSAISSSRQTLTVFVSYSKCVVYLMQNQYF